MKSEAETPPSPPPSEVEEREEDKEVKPIKQEPASASSRPPASRTLNINIVEARGLGSRDKNGGSNPFALLYDPVTHKDGKLHQKMKTKIVKKSLSPIWNAEFKIDVTDETIETIVIEVFHKRQMLVGSSKKVSLGAAVIQINDLSTTIRDQWYPLYPAKNVQGRKTHSVGGDLLPVSGEVHVILNIINDGAVGDPSHAPHDEEQQEQPSKIVVTAQVKETSTSETEATKKKGGNKDVKTRLKTLLNTSSYAQNLLDSKHPNMETSGLITSYVTISYTKDSFAKYLKSELEESPDIDLFTIPFPAVITEMYPFVDHNILSPTIWAFCSPNGFYISKTKKEAKTFGFTLTDAEGTESYVMCIKSYEPMDRETKEFVGEKLDLKESEELYFPKCFCILTKYPFYPFMRSLLKELYIATSENKTYTNDLIAFTLRSIPEPNNTNPISVTIGKTQLPIIKGERRGELPYVETPYNYIFRNLRVNEIVRIFDNLLMEEKVIFLSSSVTKLCVFMDFVKSLMYPLKWPYSFIPILPLCLLDYLGSPTPFLIGMLTEHEKFIPKTELDSICIVNLDTGECAHPSSASTPDIPADEKSRLVSDLNTVCAHMHEDPDSLDWDYGQSTNSRKCVSDREFGMNIRAAFLRFFCSILKDYHKYMIFVRVFGQNRKGPTLMFDKNGFISTRTQNSSDERFWKRLVSSQAFAVFVDDYSKPRYEVFNECFAKGIKDMNVIKIAKMITPKDSPLADTVSVNFDYNESEVGGMGTEISIDNVISAEVPPAPKMQPEKVREDFAFASDEESTNEMRQVKISENARRAIMNFIDAMVSGNERKSINGSIISLATEALTDAKCRIVFSRELVNKDLLKVNNGKLDDMEFGILGDVCRSTITESMKTDDTEVVENIFEFATAYYRIHEGAEEFLTVKKN